MGVISEADFRCIQCLKPISDTREIARNMKWTNTVKQLVDANKIMAVVPCCEPVDGDLVRINTSIGRHVDGIVIAVRCTWPDGNKYYITEKGKMYYADDVKVLEIIGKCVFSVYV